MRRAALALALALAALAAGGCGGDHHSRSGSPTPRAGTPGKRPGGDRPPSTEEQLQALLDRRAAALAAGNPRGYAATAAGPLRRRDRRAARDASGLGLASVRLVLRRARVDGRRARVRVVAVWRLRGVRGTFEDVRRLRALRTRGGWRVAGSPGGRGLMPWEVARYRRADEPHFVVLAPAGLDVAAAGLPAALADGYARFAAALPSARLRRRYLVVVAGTAVAARRLTESIRGVESLAAVSDTAVRESGPAERVRDVISQRLLVVWPAFAALGGGERRRVVAHELTHLVLAAATSGRTPSWLVEGMALYVSGDRRSDEASAVLRGLASQSAAARPALDLRRLSTPNAIARLRGAEQAGAYAYASAAAFALADTYGRHALLRLYVAFNDRSLRGRPGPRLVDRALRRTLGVSLAAFERRLRASLS